MMLLVRLRSTKSTRFIKKNPFFLFFKGKSFKFLKKEFIKRSDSLFVKKNHSISYFISPKNCLPSFTIFTDNYSKFIGSTENSLWLIKSYRNKVSYSQMGPPTSFYDRGTAYYFNLSYRFLVDWDLINFVFFKCFDMTTGKLLYRAGAGNFVTTASMSSELGFVSMVLPSGFIKKLPILSIGLVGRSVGVVKAFTFTGKFKFSNKKKSVRGIAMNPVDHPNGGRSNIKTPFMTKYNGLAKKGK